MISHNVYQYRRLGAMQSDKNDYGLVLNGFPPRPIISELDTEDWERYGNIHYARRNRAYLHRTVDEDERFYMRRLA